MSSDTLAPLLELHRKGRELTGKGHLLRGAENFGRAVEAARALGADNIVAVYLQLLRAAALRGFALSALVLPERNATTDATACAAHFAESHALLCSAMAALERRRVAGTLLEGKCSAVEEAWYARIARQDDARVTAAMAADVAPLFGYEQFIYAAAQAAGLLFGMSRCAIACSNEQLQSFLQHVVHAAELVQQPRRNANASVPSEVSFVDGLRNIVESPHETGLDARLLQPLARAWQRLQRSGVVQARRLEEPVGQINMVADARIAAIQKSLTAPGLRTCALDGCGAREAHPAHFKNCGACLTVVYCSKEHQVAGWPAHKKACKAARKAAAAAEDGAGPSDA